MIIIAKPWLWWTLPASFRQNVAPPRPETRVRGYKEQFWDDYCNNQRMLGSINWSLHQILKWMASAKMNSHPPTQATVKLTGWNILLQLLAYDMCHNIAIYWYEASWQSWQTGYVACAWMQKSAIIHVCVQPMCNVKRGQYLITGGHNNVMSHNYHTMIDFWHMALGQNVWLNT